MTAMSKTPRRPPSPGQAVRAVIKSAVFFLKVLPMLPSGPEDWLTSPPVRQHVTFATASGSGEGDLYRPSSPGPHPGIVVCLGVVPFGFDHPQIPRLGEALARSGFAALLYRSPAMENYRLVPEDVGNVAAAHHYLINQPFVQGEKSGLLGTCVGGSFALLAAAHPAIRDSVAFIGAFAPYASMQTLAMEVACSTRLYGSVPEPWEVDTLTRKVYLHSLTGMLETGEADHLLSIDEQSIPIEVNRLSPDAKAVYALLTATDPDHARVAMTRLPPALLDRMDAISPLQHLDDIHARLIVLGHDQDDLVIPVGESRCLWDALASRTGVRYTEFEMFQHADPTRRRLKPHRLARELWKFYRYVYPLFREAVS